MYEIKICLVIIGGADGIVGELEKVIIDVPSFIEGRGFFISTFTTNKTICELKNYFKEQKRNFLLFEIDKSKSAYHFLDQEIEKGLFMFSDIEKDNDDVLVNIDILDNKKINPELTKKNILKMTKKQKEDKLNELIDKGVYNLTNEEKYMLNLLVS